MVDKGFLICPKCKKKMLRRRPNGLFSFAFGQWAGKDIVIVDGKEVSLGPTVQIEVFGSLKMRCIRKSCREKHPDFWITFDFFPSNEERIKIESQSAKAEVQPAI